MVLALFSPFLALPLSYWTFENNGDISPSNIEFSTSWAFVFEQTLASDIRTITEDGIEPVDQTLKKLRAYSEIITHESPDYIMVFMRIPYSQKSAREYALEISTIAKEYALYWFKPIFIFEPSSDGSGANLEQILNGKYDKNISFLFSQLSKVHKISEEQLGMIVPYPEINTPAFDRSNFSPSDFSKIYNRFFVLAREYYPTLRGSILLDTKSYEDDSWDSWTQSSLQPYLSGIEKTYVHSFWLQGFPWMSEDGKTKVMSMRKLLPLNLIDEASKILGTKNIWLNTGTIWRIYTSDTRIEPNERWQTLNSLLMYMRVLKLRWYTPLINIFSQNNLSRSGEQTDWSYTQSKEDLTIFGEFLRRAHASKIQVWFFDQ